MRILVQKFGGTSVATAKKRQVAVRRIEEAIANGFTPVVVVSAMGRRGDPYATDTLIDLIQKIDPDVAPRELDLLVSCGETISAVVMAGTLHQAGVGNTVVLTGGQAGIITDRNYGNARILRVEPEHIRRHLDRGDLVIVTGFQGISESNDLTTLGRGGSDTTAAALGVALRAEIVEIYTDVDGVMTADPRIVPQAQKIRQTCYEELLQMANQGAKIVHHRAIELAMRANLPLRIRNTFSDDEGTWVAHHYEERASFSSGRTVTAITHMPARALITVQRQQGNERPIGNTSIFRPLADANISLDLFNLSPQQTSFTIHVAHSERVRAILENMGVHVSVIANCAKISAIGVGMHNQPGVMANLVEALEKRNIEILQTTDSNVTISCLVREADMNAAVQALHEQFGLHECEGLN